MSPRAETVVPLEPGQTLEIMPVEVGREVEVEVEVEEVEAAPVDVIADVSEENVCVPVDGDDEEMAPPAVGFAVVVGAAVHQLLATQAQLFRRH
jgi:hypothetical protein